MKIRFKFWEYARISMQPSYLPFVRLTAWGYNAHRSGFVFHSQQPMSWVSEAQAGDMESMFQGKMLTVSKPWDRTRECMPNVVPTSNGWVNVSYWKLYPCLKTQSLSAMFSLNLAVLFFALGQKPMPTGAAYCELEKTHLAPSGKEMLVENMSGVQLTKSFVALYQWWPMFGDYGFWKTAMSLQKMTQQADWWMIVIDPCIEGKHQRTIRFHYFPTCQVRVVRFYVRLFSSSFSFSSFFSFFSFSSFSSFVVVLLSFVVLLN